MKPSDFEPEAPTWVNTPQSRLAKLARDWRECSLVQQKTLERMADKLARLPKVAPR